MDKLKDFCRNHYYLLTGLLMFLSFPSFDILIFKGFAFFAWIFMIPLFVYVQGKSLKQVYIASFLAGLLGNFLTYQWIGFFAGDQTAGYLLIVCFLMPCLSVFFALKIFAAELISRRMPRLRFLIYPVMWCFMDWIQSVGYLAFPWTNVAHSQYTSTAFIQSASVIGVVGINFLIIFTSYSLSQVLRLYLAEKKFSPRSVIFIRAALTVVLVIVINICGLAVLSSSPSAEKKDMRIGIAQSCINPWDGWEVNRMRYLSELKEYTNDVLDKSPDLIIWSESATLEMISFDYAKERINQYESELFAYIKEINKPLFTGEIGVTSERRGFYTMRYPQNNAVLISGEGEPVDAYSKINLVPFGEWFPYAGVPFIGRFIGNIASDFGGSSFVPGSSPKLIRVNGRAFAPLICYEGIFYRLCRRYKEMGADFFVNITNDGWSKTYSGHMQHFSGEVFRAVENGIWLVRAGNTGYSAFVDPYGRITASMPILRKGSFAGDIDFGLNHSTFYSRFGGYIQAVLLFAAVLFIAAFIFFSVFHHGPRKNKASNMEIFKQ
ncbi:MAG: apolipoprotein N-acyltransferase [Spirochaetia bacterium]|jgi:apolipoprotein N-acyltransferase|nr:apolipoprotein N-acyltransferase [Spirochaetia bacterium]